MVIVRRFGLAGAGMALAGLLGLAAGAGKPVWASSQAPSQKRTFVTTIAGRESWVTVIRRGTAQPSSQTDTWYKWGNTSSDEYAFAFGVKSQIRLVVSFQTLAGGRREAKLFTNRLGKSPIRYRLKGGRLRILSEHGYPYVVVKTRHGGWIYDGKTNYNLTMWTDGLSSLGAPKLYPNGRPNTISYVSQRVPGVPDLEISRVLTDPHKGWGYVRTEIEKRIASAPPFQASPGLIPGFPYLGVGNGKFHWFLRNPNPLYFSLPALQLLLNPVVGFENAGNYRINSLSDPPKVDFESPFAYYNFLPNSRYSQLVIRSESFPAGDPYGGQLQSHRNMTSFRYSWTGKGAYLWDYSLQVAGSISLNHTVRLDNFAIKSIGPRDLPVWVMGQKWPLVSFVQAMNGYPGSEGIYEYTPQIPQAWPWLLGSSPSPPAYWAHPYFSNHTGTATNKNRHPGETLATGFRGEYNASDFRPPTLYVSPIDGLVHLAWAKTGVWNLGQGWYIRSNNLAGGPFFDEWQLKHLSHPGKDPRAWGGTTVQAVYDLGRYVIYDGPSGTVVRRLDKMSRPQVVAAPTSAATWRVFLSQVGSAVKGNPPKDMQSWVTRLSGVSSVLRGVFVTSVTHSQSGFHMTLVATQRETLQHAFTGLPKVLAPGRYALAYRSASQRWTITPAVVGAVRTRAKVPVPHLDQRTVVTVRLTNTGNLARTVRASLSIRGYSRATQVTIPADSTVSHRWTWLPQHVGGVPVIVRVAGLTVSRHQFQVSAPRRMRYFLESLPGGTSTVAGAALALVMLGSVAAWLSTTRTDWRRRIGLSGGQHK